MENRRRDMPVTEQSSPINAGASSSSFSNTFRPTDQELITSYLAKRVQNQTFPANNIIEVNIYDHHPETLSKELMKPDLMYCFTSRVRRGRKQDGSPIWNRTTKAGGTWDSRGNKQNVMSSGEVIGNKSMLAYYNNGNRNSGQKSDWMMFEYTLPDKLEDCVLCKIYRKKGNQGSSSVQGDVKNNDETGDLQENEIQTDEFLENHSYEQFLQDTNTSSPNLSSSSNFYGQQGLGLNTSFMQPSSSNTFQDMNTSSRSLSPHMNTSLPNPSSSFGFDQQDTGVNSSFLQPSSSNTFPDMNTSSPNPSSSFGFDQQDTGVNPSFLQASSSNLYPDINTSSPNLLSSISFDGQHDLGLNSSFLSKFALKGFVNPKIRAPSMEAASTHYAKGSADQLEAPTQDNSMGNQGNHQDISDHVSQEDDGSTQLTNSAHPQPKEEK